MSGRRPTILDVAREAGVSKSLVSMALRGDPGPSEASRQAVLEAAQRLGYRPNRAASILAAGRTRTIGVAIDDYRNLWYVSLFAGIRDALEPVGIRIATADKSSNAHLAVSPFDDLLSLRVDGIIVAADLAAAQGGAGEVPVVMAGLRSNPIAGADVVAADDAVGAELAVRHLIERGHREIGHLAGSDGTGIRRRDAYLATMRDAGLEPLVVGGDDPAAADGGLPDTTEAVGHAGALQLFEQNPGATAIFAANDTMAIGALGAARELGRRVPDDLSVVGYDDSPLAGSSLLRLTSVDARWREVGRVAAETLLARIDGAEPALDGAAALVPMLVERGTTGPAPGSTAQRTS